MPREEVLERAPGDGHRGGRQLGDGQVLGDDVLRRPRALRLHERGLRAVRPRQRAPARHLPEHDQVRGRDHRHDPRPAARRRRHRRRAVRPRHLGRHRQHPPRRARLPRARPPDPRASTGPNLIKPETAHPAFDKACHLFGIEVRNAPIDPETTQVDVDAMADADRRPTRSPSSARPATTATARSTRSTSCPTSRSSAASACTSTAASAASSSRSARSSATTSRVFDFRLPGVTSISADTHKYGYGFKGTSVAQRSATRRCATRQYFFLTDWTGGKYCSPGIEGSRSGGLLAATWASMVTHRPRGLPRLRQGASSRRRTRCRTRCARTPSCGSWATRRSASASRPTSSTSTTSTTSCGPRAGASTASSTRTRSTWRSPGRRPSPAWSSAFTADLAEAVAYAREHTDEHAARARAIYGGVAGGMTDEADEFIRSVMADMMDRHQSVP